MLLRQVFCAVLLALAVLAVTDASLFTGTGAPVAMAGDDGGDN